MNLKKRDYIRIIIAPLVNYHYVSLNAQSIIDISMQICLTDCETDCDIEIRHNLAKFTAPPSPRVHCGAVVPGIS